MKSVCSRCAGKGFVNADGTPNNAFSGSDSDPTIICPRCVGTGRRGEPWQFIANDSILAKGPVFVGARKNSRGPWMEAEDLPDYVRMFLGLVRSDDIKPEDRAFLLDKGISDATREGTGVFFRWHLSDYVGKTCAQMKADTPGTVVWQKDKDYAARGVFELTPPPTEIKKRRKIPAKTPAIRNLADLCAYFCADTPDQLNRRIYKATGCGASISVQDLEGKWHHNGQEPWGVTEIQAFTIQTIVEGSDATVDSDEFVLPVTEEEVEHWIEDMEAEAHDLWEDANNPTCVCGHRSDKHRWDDDPSAGIAGTVKGYECNEKDCDCKEFHDECGSFDDAEENPRWEKI